MTEVLTSESGKRMLGYWPAIYRDSYILQAIYQANGQEMDDLDVLTDEVRLQLFPQTATWGLRIWEQSLGLPVIESQPLELRRAKVESRLMTRYPITRAQMENIVNQFVSNKSAQISVYPERYAFRVEIPAGDFVWIDALVDAVHYAKPAHLTFYLLLRLIHKRLIESRVRYRVVQRVKFPGPFLVPIDDSIPIDGSWSSNGREIGHRSRITLHAPQHVHINNSRNHFSNLVLRHQQKVSQARSKVVHRVKFPGPLLLAIDGSAPIDGSWSSNGREIAHRQHIAVAATPHTFQSGSGSGFRVTAKRPNEKGVRTRVAMVTTVVGSSLHQRRKRVIMTSVFRTGGRIEGWGETDYYPIKHLPIDGSWAIQGTAVAPLEVIAADRSQSRSRIAVYTADGVCTKRILVR